MTIKDKLRSIRIGLTAGVKATDHMLKIADQMEKSAKDILDAVEQIKEITPDDEEEDGETDLPASGPPLTDH